MLNIKIALHQFNPIVGDTEANSEKILASIVAASANGCNLFVTSELAITGYSPKDLIFRDGFYEKQHQAIDKLLNLSGITIVCGVYYREDNENIPNEISNSYTQNQYGKITKTYNSAIVIRDGKILKRYDKQLLPNYGVFEECRYFYPGNESVVFDCDGVKVGIVICEDMWREGPIKAAKTSGAEVICILNASPYDHEKHLKRLESAKARVLENQIPLIYVNQVGGQDELVFDGASFALNNKANLMLQASAFEENLRYVNYSDLVGVDSCLRRNDKIASMDDKIASMDDKITSSNENDINCHLRKCVDPNWYDKAWVAYPDKIPGMYQALVLSMRDYINKNGFKGIVLGLSGGIDSALTLAIAYDAIGSDRIMAVMMPSRYTLDISNIDAQEMVDILKIQSSVIPIENIVETFKNELGDVLNTSSDINPNDTTFENLQARSRGVILMAISNRLGYLLVTTGNKSEMATGYATLYGDMAGGFALLKDVTKTNVYALSLYRNSKSYVIPERIITRAPSAELRENQTDQDSLPEYEILDQILEMLVENNMSVEKIVEHGFNAQDANKVGQLLKISEHKRSQAAIGPKVTKRSFGNDWAMPLTHKFKF